MKQLGDAVRKGTERYSTESGAVVELSIGKFRLRGSGKDAESQTRCHANGGSQSSVQHTVR